MTSSQRNGLLALLFLLASGFAAALWWLARVPAAGPTEAPAPVAIAEPQVAPQAAGEHSERPPSELVAPALAPVPPTTVVFPLELSLELVRSAVALKADGVAALGSAATARIKGSIRDHNGVGVRAEIDFIAGANDGRILYCDRDGGFGADDLYPGISVVRVHGPGILGSLREVRLRQDRDSLLNIGYGRPAVVYGFVGDGEANPIAEALVTIDGQEVRTDEHGEFLFSRIASGDVLAIVEKQGYCAQRQILNVVAGGLIEKGTLKFSLQRGARLELTIEERIGTENQARIFILPQVASAERKFPWYRVNPVRLYPGGTITLEDLPAGGVTLRTFHPGAVAVPPTRAVQLSAGDTTHEVLHIEPAPSVAGRITHDGQPVVGALVRMEVPDRVRAMLSVFGTTEAMFLESDVLPNLPPAVQETTTNAAGEYQLSANESYSPERYLVALSPDGKTSGNAILHSGDRRADLTLAEVRGGEAALIVQMDRRVQPLPVKITVRGNPRGDVLLAPDQDLHIDGLTPGTWRVNARWSTDVLLHDQALEIEKEVTLALELPTGAIEGQDADTRKRAGKR